MTHPPSAATTEKESAVCELSVENVTCSAMEAILSWMLTVTRWLVWRSTYMHFLAREDKKLRCTLFCYDISTAGS